MKKIKRLYSFIRILIMVYIIHYLPIIYLAFYPPEFMNFSENHFDTFIFGYYTQFVSLGFTCIIFVALFFVKNGLSITIKKGFFNQNSSKKFLVAGQLFLISGVLSLLWDYALIITSKGGIHFSELSSDILLILIGYSLLIIADYISSGNEIKQENDLTI